MQFPGFRRKLQDLFGRFWSHVRLLLVLLSRYVLCKKYIFSATKPQLICYDTLTQADNSILKSVGNLKSTKPNIQKSLLKNKNNVSHVTENNKRKNLAQTKNSQLSSISDFKQPIIPLKPSLPSTACSNPNNAVNDDEFGKYISFSRTWEILSSYFNKKIGGLLKFNFETFNYFYAITKYFEHHTYCTKKMLTRTW